MQLGFVIDHSRCIGCHACTVACKSENDVPLGDFRTWVKYTEVGEWPEVKRSFAVLRCNQCSDAPCVAICPVTALDKRKDGIVDLDRDVCIGCKACMQGCPYDALYLNEGTGTAEKCHFCAHRVEIGLAPACAVVCPTEAIVPGDWDDPTSPVSRLARQHDLSVRKPEAGTRPNVAYVDVAPGGIDPLATSAAGSFLWANRRPGPQLDAETFAAFERRAREGAAPDAHANGHANGHGARTHGHDAQPALARTTYSVDRKPLWGRAITGYLFFKSLAAGVFVSGLAFLPPIEGTSRASPLAAWLVPFLALLFLGATMALLVADLKRPERFLSILLRPNWNSWLAKGSFVLSGYGALLTLWFALGVLGVPADGTGGLLLALASTVLAGLSACYTAWLFGQAKGRVLWMKRGFVVHLLAQAALAGGALVVALQWLCGADGWLPLVDAGPLFGAGAFDPKWLLLVGLLAHLALTVSEEAMAPAGREAEFARACRLVTHGPYARRHWLVGVLLGGLLPVTLLLAPVGDGVVALAAVLALVGLWTEEDVFVRAGQALPIS